jgi:hypothetical protein
MKALHKDHVSVGERLEYHAPEITDLGSVAELTQAAGTVNSNTLDGAGYHVAGHS